MEVARKRLVDSFSRNAREVAFRTLLAAERRGRLDLQELLDAALRRAALSEVEARLAAELVYGSVRWRRRLDMAINALVPCPRQVSPEARVLIRLGIYQLLFLERIPPHAAVYETVALARRFGVDPGFVNALLRAVQRNGDPVKYPDRQRHPVAFLVRRYSYPDWLVRRWVAAWGLDEAEALCVAYNTPAPFHLRTNLLKTTREELSRRLQDDNVSVTRGEYCRTALVTKRLPIPSVSFSEGLFTVQDESSQLVTELLDPQPGETIFDLCAAPGGKTTHIAERMGDRGRVVAMDISAKGLERVEENLRRLGLRCVTTRLHDAREPLDEFADRVLVDAPCSGVGVLRRRAEARWGKDDDDVNRLAVRQFEILRNAARWVRPGGVLVYGVCTDTREETVELVKRFCEEEPHFRLESAKELLPALPEDAFDEEGALRVFPHRHRLDGFYAVRFRRLL